MRFNFIALLMLFAMLLAGCSNCCPQKPAKCGFCCAVEKCKSAAGCGPFVDAGMCDCMDFFSMTDPSTKENPTAEEIKLYAIKGFQCAKRLGMVPIDPKYGKPVVCCPMERVIDYDAPCPPACVYEETGKTGAMPAEKGFLLTAFDTPTGIRYVIIEADKNFAKGASLSKVGKEFEDVVDVLDATRGKVVVYLTGFPLIVPQVNEKSRAPSSAEVTAFKRSLGVVARDIMFVNWK